MSLNPGSYIHIRKDGAASGDGLLPGRVLWSHGTLVAAEMDSRAIVDGSEEPMTLHYEVNHKFVQQPTQLEGVIEQEAADAPTDDDLTAMDLEDNARRVVVVFELMGEATEAENRECYRVRATPFRIKIDFAGQPDCQLTDISQIGFALISTEEFKPGAIVKVNLPVGDEVVGGNVRVQSVRRLRNGQFRYGVICLGRETEQACAKLATELQRQQLLRLAGRT